MPSYDFICFECDNKFSDFVPYEQRGMQLCDNCGGPAEMLFPVEAVQGIVVSEGGYCEQLDCDVTSERDMIEKAKRLGYVQAGDHVGGARNDEKKQHGLYKARGKNFDDKLRERDKKKALQQGWKAFAQTSDGREVPVKETSVKSTTKGVSVRHLTQ